MTTPRLRRMKAQEKSENRLLLMLAAGFILIISALISSTP